MSKAFEVDNLTVHYDREPVLWEVNLSVPENKIIGIIGPNGAGKSTLIKAALEIVPVMSGTISFFGLPLKKMRKEIAYVPQRGLIDWDFPITVFDVVLMGCYEKLFFWSGKNEKERVWGALEKVGLKEYANRQIDALSGGQKQRLFFARAIVQKASIFFLDEPFQGVDATTEKILMNLLQEMKEEGKTIFIVHHDLSCLQKYFDYLIFLHRRVIAEGPIDEVLTQENLCKTFGKNSSLLDEVFELSLIQKTGQPM